MNNIIVCINNFYKYGLRLILGLFILMITTNSFAATAEKKNTQTKITQLKKNSVTKPSVKNSVKKKNLRKKTVKLPLKKVKKLNKNFVNTRYAALIINSNDGTILHQESAEELRYPASLTKIMTIYLAFEALSLNKLQMDKLVPVSEHAAKMPKTNLGLRQGELISVRNLVMSLIVKSANDSAVVLAEAISGSEEAFAVKMTERAKQLGMKDTCFKNASGLHKNEQKTTAIDLAKLAIALKRDFPEHYPLFAQNSFYYKGKLVNGHDNLKKHYPGTEGIKTGFVNASGFNLVTSAKRGNVNLIGVVLGGHTAVARDSRMMSLLNHHFANLKAPKVEKQLAKIDSDNSAPKVLARKKRIIAKKTNVRLASINKKTKSNS